MMLESILVNGVVSWAWLGMTKQMRDVTMFALQKWHRSASQVVSLHRLINAAQRWLDALTLGLRWSEQA